MNRIELPRGIWHYDPGDSLGKGGFGAVFRGASDDQEPVAVKRLKRDGHREKEIADELIGTEFAYVMPFLDAGQDSNSDSCFVVMPLAEKSLQKDLDNGETWDDKHDLSSARA